MWKRDMHKRHSERKIYWMKIHSISNQRDCNHFWCFHKQKSLCKTLYLGGWLTQWLSRRLVRMMVPIRCSSLQLSCSICVLRSCSLCCFFNLQHTWLRLGGGPTSIAGRAHCTLWQVRKRLVHFLFSYTTFNIDREVARVGDQVRLITDSKNMLLCRIRLVSLPYACTSQDVQYQ